MPNMRATGAYVTYYADDTVLHFAHCPTGKHKPGAAHCSTGKPGAKRKLVKTAGAYGSTKKGRLSKEDAATITVNFDIGNMRITRARHCVSPDKMYDLLEDENWDVA